MNLSAPYPADLLRLAQKVVWYDKPEETLADVRTFLAHLMVHGSSADVSMASFMFQRKNSEEYLRTLLLAFSRNKFGRDGMTGLEMSTSPLPTPPVSRWLVWPGGWPSLWPLAGWKCSTPQRQTRVS